MKVTIDIDPSEARAALWTLQKICSQIDQAAEQRVREETPTPKQINYAKDIARQRGISPPDFSKVTKAELSKWIEDALGLPVRG